MCVFLGVPINAYRSALHSCEGSLVSSRAVKDPQTRLRYGSDVLVLCTMETSVNAALSGGTTLHRAAGSQTQVPILTLTRKTSHFPFCSNSEDIFLLNGEKISPSNRILRLLQRLHSFLYSIARVALLGE